MLKLGQRTLSMSRKFSDAFGFRRLYDGLIIIGMTSHFGIPPIMQVTVGPPGARWRKGREDPAPFKYKRAMQPGTKDGSAPAKIGALGD
jgi:hypothetical protein